MADRTNAAVTAQIDTTDSNMPRISVGHNSRPLTHLDFGVLMMQKQPCRANIHEKANHSFKNDKSVSGHHFSSPARCHPKVMAPVGGLEDSHRENRLMAMLPKSVRRCAASVMMARLCAAYPPAERARRQKAGLLFSASIKRWPKASCVSFSADQSTLQS